MKVAAAAGIHCSAALCHAAENAKHVRCNCICCNVLGANWLCLFAFFFSRSLLIVELPFLMV
jgi:hypothetical protein